MRRSFAPSQTGPASKRPRFNPPQRSTQDVLRLVNAAVPRDQISEEKTSGSTRNHPQSSVSSTSKNVLQSKPKFSGFTPPMFSTVKTVKSAEDSDNTVSNKVTYFKPDDPDDKNESVDSIETPKIQEKSDGDFHGEENHQQNFKENIEPSNHANGNDDDSDRTSRGCFQVNEAEQQPNSEEQTNDSDALSHAKDDEPDSVASAVSTNLPKPTCKVHEVPGARFRPSFKMPQKTPQLQNANQKAVETPNCEAGPKKCYYSVMWCKLSKKKHKKWEGDAILVTSGRSVSLLDMDSKEIGRGSGYKTAELNSMQEGHSLNIGGKEIEVMSVLSESEYKSGKCFQASAAVDAPLAAPRKALAGASKPFINPNKGHTSHGHKTSALSTGAPSVKVSPRYDPTAPDALVMPRPSLAHQWQHNKQQVPLVDVVVDPHLSRKLRPHQRDGVVFLYQCVMGMRSYAGQGAILADEMGLGKTLQCISLVWTLLKQGVYGGKPVIRRTLVLTPGSLVKNWKAEFRKWLGNERIQVFAVDADNKVQDYTTNPQQPVFIVSYEMFVRYHDLISKISLDLVLCDEGHRLKNTGIKTTTLVSSLLTRRRVVLTGTPVQNDLQELHSLIDFCNPGLLGTSNSFHHVYENPITKSRLPSADEEEKILGETRAAELNRVTSQFILRRTQEINNKYLPPKVELVVFCRPSPLQHELYLQLLRSRTIASCLHDNRESAQHLMCLAALKKLCNHPALIHKNAVQSAKDKRDNDEVEIMAWCCPGDKPLSEPTMLYSGLAPLYPEDFNAAEASVEHSGKMLVLSQLLEAMYNTKPLQRVVLVSNYTQTLDLFQSLCTSAGYNFLRLDGSTPTSTRQKLVDQFNSPYSNTFVFLLSSKAGGVGLNLVGASRLILYDIDWNPANDLQAMARVWRDGQRRKVFIYRLLTTGSVEEKIYQRQVSKQGLSGVVVDAKTSSQAHFSPQQLKALFRPLQTTLCSTHDLIGCSCCHDDSQPETAPSDVSRDCQLDAVKGLASNQQNLCMSELMQWQHLSGPQLQLDAIDPVMCGQALEEATFAFWTEVQTAT